MLFWCDVAAHAWAAVEVSIAHLKFTNEMYLQVLGFMLVPVSGQPSKCAKVADAGTEKCTDPKGKGKACADVMDEDNVIVLDANLEEWDGIA